MRINEKDLNKLNIKNNQKKKPKTYYDRLNEAIKTGFCFKNDKIQLKEKVLIIDLNNVYLLSHNDILRIHYKKLYPYIKLWKDRIKHVVEKVNLKSNGWKIKENYKYKIEVLYTTKNSNYLDYDAVISASKYIIDGLIVSGVIEDDSIDFVPVILSKQNKNKEKNAIKVVVSQISEEEYMSYYSEEFKKSF